MLAAANTTNVRPIPLPQQWQAGGLAGWLGGSSFVFLRHGGPNSAANQRPWNWVRCTLLFPPAS